MVELAPAASAADQTDNSLMQVGFAGDVLNTLWYARAGFGASGQAAFYSATGTDTWSDRMVDFIEGGGIDCSAVRRIADRRPGLYMIQLDGAERSFSYWRGESAARRLADDPDHLVAAIDRATAIYVSGITLAILTPQARSTLIVLMEHARDGGKVVAFDPNIRPGLWESAAALRNAITDAARASSIILPSFEDEAAHFGDADPGETIKRYSRFGEPMVIVKDGPGDVTVAHGGDVQSIPTALVSDAIDTTGAGDAFNGAFLTHYLQGGDARAAVEAGQACSARVIRHRGALIPNLA